MLNPIQFYPYLKKYSKNIILGLTCLIIVSGINLSIPLVIKEFIARISATSIENSGLKANIPYFALILLGMFLLQGVFGFFRIHQFNLLAANYIRDLKNNIFSNLLAKPASFHANLKTGDFISKLSADTQIIQEVIASKFSIAIRYGIQVVGGIILLLLTSL